MAGDVSIWGTGIDILVWVKKKGVASVASPFLFCAENTGYIMGDY